MTVSIQELKEQLLESVARCEAGQSSIEVAQSRLNDALTLGRDTDKARAVLKKCQQLFKDAEAQRLGVLDAINIYYNAVDGERANSIVSVINANIAALLAPFDLNKYQQEV